MNLEKYKDRFSPEVFKHLREIIETNPEIEEVEFENYTQLFYNALNIDPGIDPAELRKAWATPGSVIKLNQKLPNIRGAIHLSQRPTLIIVDDPEDSVPKTTGIIDWIKGVF